MHIIRHKTGLITINDTALFYVNQHVLTNINQP
jgi:hypothetical protein